jgi:hypothetical protein
MESSCIIQAGLLLASASQVAGTTSIYNCAQLPAELFLVALEFKPCRTFNGQIYFTFLPKDI